MQDREASLQEPLRFSVRPLVRSGANHDTEVDLVAHRMRATLVEVLGHEQGFARYTIEWLRDRVRFHLDPTRSTGEVFLADAGADGIWGHTIVRAEQDASGAFGLFSTIWVEPAHRRHGVAKRLLDAGEAWFEGHGLSRFATDTSSSNTPLIALFSRRGYAITFRDEALGMVRLTRTHSTLGPSRPHSR